MTIYSDPNIASDSFGITLNETFRTAAFGGDKLEVGNAPAADYTSEYTP